MNVFQEARDTFVNISLLTTSNVYTFDYRINTTLRFQLTNDIS